MQESGVGDQVRVAGWWWREEAAAVVAESRCGTEERSAEKARA
jgi:hypothetical protein